jgi:peptidoglycan/LPS O-acetylase OafA/YrhL
MRTQPGGRLGALDALRGVAALLVMGFHYTVAFDAPFAMGGRGYPTSALDLSFGRHGVELFFVISGFVILWTTLKSPGVKRFWVSRFSRLYPPFWTSLLLIPLWWLLSGYGPGSTIGMTRPTPVRFLSNITMVPTWFGQPNLDGAYWTLAIEMLFYLVVTALIIFKLLEPRRLIRAVAVLWVLFVVGNALSGYSSAGYHPPESFAPYFFSGMAIYLFSVDPQTDRVLKMFLIAGPIVAEAARLSLTQIAVAIVAVGLVLAVSQGYLRFLEAKPLLWFGKISYSLYLVHSTLGYLLMARLLDHGVNRYVAMLVAAAAAIAVGAIVNVVVEQRISPFVRRKLSGAVASASTRPA